MQVEIFSFTLKMSAIHPEMEPSDTLLAELP